MFVIGGLSLASLVSIPDAWGLSWCGGPDSRRAAHWYSCSSVDDGDRDVAFDPDELVGCGVVAADEDDVVVELDAGGVVVEAEVAPRHVVDEVAVLGVV